MSNEIEAPSGKGAGDENFPVGSFLISKELRPIVSAYYDFARAGDDIADNPALTPDAKIARLNAFESALLTPENAPAKAQKAIRLSNALTSHQIDLERGRKLLDAFRQDAVKARYEDWEKLLDYCTKSADPVGRFLLDLHGESPQHYDYSDALCTVLQILNHLQDCGKDREEMDRIYIPLSYLEAENLDVSVLDKNVSPPAFRNVLNRMLKNLEPLLERCRDLAPHLKNRRLAAESAVIVALALRLHKRLQSGDPLAERVKLTKLDFFRASLAGIYRLIFHKHV